MSSSPSRAPVPSSTQTPPQTEQPVLPFPYDDVGSTGGRTFLPKGKTESDSSASAGQSLELEAKARELGRQQGALEVSAKFQEQLARERTAIATALAEFAEERATYYQKIETEAVQLALSIARKILHREAQVDPLLLMGIVRVALEQVEGATGVTLAVHPPQAAEWRQYLASHMNPKNVPDIDEDAALEPGQCELRTSMGTAQLGVEVQLKEIEQGMMDLLAARPEGKS